MEEEIEVKQSKEEAEEDSIAMLKPGLLQQLKSHLDLLDRRPFILLIL